MPRPAESASNVPLAAYTTLRVGGPAEQFVEVFDQDELIDVVTMCDAKLTPVLLLGGGSNVVIADAGFNGTVIKISTTGVELHDGAHEDQVTVRAQSGEPWDRLVAELISDGYSGIEVLSGIPGTVGATPIQNVGAYGHEVAESIRSVEVFDRVERIRRTMTPAECEFSYRNSKFKREPGRWLVLAVSLRLNRSTTSQPIRYEDLARKLEVAVGDTDRAIAVRRAVLAIRRSKGMVLDIDDHDTWSVGSFFTNPIVDKDQLAKVPDDAPRWPVDDRRVKLSAAWLIEHSGFAKGWSPTPDGQAAVSTKHTLALTNRGHATAHDVLVAAAQIRTGVEHNYGVHLEVEPQILP